MVAQDEQEPKYAQAPRDVQNHIGQMVDQGSRSANGGIEHDAERLQGPVEVTVPEEGIGGKVQLPIGQVPEKVKVGLENGTYRPSQ